LATIWRMDLISRFILSAVLAFPTLAFSQEPPAREKVAEGQFCQWNDGRPVSDTMQAWTMWRTADGYEVEDHLPIDKSAAFAAMLGAAGTRMTAELDEEIRGGSMATDIHLRLSKQGAVQGLIVNGKKLKDGKDVQIANCQSADSDIVCKGHANTTRLKSL